MKTSRKTLMTTILTISAALLVSACQDDQAAYPQRAMPGGLMDDTARGHELFIDKCVTCHGKTGEGRSDRAAFFNPPAPDFIENRYRNIDPAFLFWRIEKGKSIEPYLSQGSVMPAWGMHLSEIEIWQIVAYLRSRAH